MDNVVNSQGQKLLEFLNDTRSCIVNGRITPENDNFTSVTGYRRKSVVDYCIVRNDDLSNVRKCQVISCNDIIEHINLTGLLSEVCHKPDHNLIRMEIEVAVIVSEVLLRDRNLGSESVRRAKIIRKTGNKYINGITATRMLPILLQGLEREKINQSEIDELYDKICKLLVSEAAKSLDSNSRKRKNTKRREYWDLELSVTWRDMCRTEKSFTEHSRKHSSHDIRGKHLWTKFKCSQKVFDKMLRKKRCAYCKGMMLHIEDYYRKNDPRTFWDQINKIGPKKKSKIPWEVCIDSKIVTGKFKCSGKMEM